MNQPIPKPAIRLATLSVLGALALAAPAPAQVSGDYFFETLPFPSPSYAYDINNSGQAVVYVFSAAPVDPAETYLWENGEITNIKFPGSAPDGITQGYAINDKGEVFGRYSLDHPSVSPTKGFRRDKHGAFTSIEFPGAVQTEVQSANNSGDVCGIYFMENEFFPRSYTRDGKGNFAPVVVPFAGAFFGGAATITLGVNARGDISGIYFDDNFNFHGFIRDKHGVFTEVVHPDAPAGACTGVDRINNTGATVGTIWVDGPFGPCSLEGGSFIRSKHGVFEDVPLPPALVGGAVLAINERGDVSGYAHSSNGQAMIAWRL